LWSVYSEDIENQLECQKDNWCTKFNSQGKSSLLKLDTASEVLPLIRKSITKGSGLLVNEGVANAYIIQGILNQEIVWEGHQLSAEIAVN